jgi:hypothetical protein
MEYRSQIALPNTYVVLVTGSRNWTDRKYLWARLDEIAERVTADSGMWVGIRHGNCPTGADMMARRWCQQTTMYGHRLYKRVLDDPFTPRPEDGPPGKFLRNIAMCATRPLPAECQAFVVDESPGSSHTMKQARRHGIPVQLHPARSAGPPWSPGEAPPQMIIEEARWLA